MKDNRGNGKAVAYIRARAWKGKWAPDLELQKQRAREFAKANEYELLGIAWETAKFSLRKGIYPKFMKLLNICEKSMADFLYVDIGNWRPNIVLKQYTAVHERTKKGWKFVAIPPDRKTMEAIERQARFEKLEGKKRIQKRVSPKKEVDIHPIVRWQKKENIGTKRLKNYEHLYAGVAPIYKEIFRLEEEKPRLSNKRIAWALDRDAYLTVSGERWNDETVRKARKMINDKDFRRFLQLKENDEVDKYDA